MGLIRRLQHITRAKIEGFLESVEDPGLVFPRLVAELDATVQDALAAEAKALTAVRAAQRKRDESEGRIERLRRGAELAVRLRDDATAREALAAQVAAEDARDRILLEQQRAETAWRHAREVRGRLETDLAGLREQRDDILARARAARLAAHGPAAQAAAGSLLDQAARLEARVEADEARIGIRLTTGLSAVPLAERLSNLERQAEVDARLARLKSPAVKPRSSPGGEPNP